MNISLCGINSSIKGIIQLLTSAVFSVLPAILPAVLLVYCVMPAAHANMPEEGIIVAVIDSGIDEDNPYLDHSKILPGKSFVDGEASYEDKIGHGTAVAAIIQDYCPGASIAPLMYYTKYASGVPRNGGIEGICEAVYDAVDNYRCKIINISSGIYSESDELKAAVEYAEANNVIVISPVGNDNLIDSGRVFYPAAYDTVIGVGAVDLHNKIADFSQRNHSVMVVMHGVDIYAPSIKNAGTGTNVSGTSYAAAAVCGIAASIVAKYPSITPAEFRKLISISCSDPGEPGYDTTYGWGMPDRELLSRNLRLLTDERLQRYRGLIRADTFLLYTLRVPYVE